MYDDKAYMPMEITKGAVRYQGQGGQSLHGRALARAVLAYIVFICRPRA